MYGLLVKRGMIKLEHIFSDKLSEQLKTQFNDAYFGDIQMVDRSHPPSNRRELRTIF